MANEIKDWDKATPKGNRTNDERTREGTIHLNREATARDAEPVHEYADEPWVRPSTLPDIPAREGMVQRWIRVGLHGAADPTNNWAKKRREGWATRKIETVPSSIPVPSIEHGPFQGCIGVEGMVLCEMPATRDSQRSKFFRNKNKVQSDSVDEMVTNTNAMSGHGFGRIIQENETKVGGRMVKVAGNES